MDIVIIGKVLQRLLLSPGGFILVGFFLTVYLYAKRQKGRTAAALLTFFFYLFSLSPVAFCLIRPLESFCPPEPQVSGTPCDAVILLGGGAVRRADLAFGGSLGGAGAKRLLAAAGLAEKEKLPLLISGGSWQQDGVSEAELSFKMLRALGAGGYGLLVENKARTTQENARFSAAICGEKGYKKCYLVTSAYHMPRALLLFQKAFGPHGIVLVPFPCDYQTEEPPRFDAFSFLPDLSSLAVSTTAVKEYLGYLAALIS